MHLLCVTLTLMALNRSMEDKGDGTHMQSSQLKAGSFKNQAGKFLRKHPVVCTLVGLCLWLGAVMLYQTNKPLPAGISYESELYHTDDIRFWTDLTYPSAEGKLTQEAQITDRILQIVDEAEQFLVIDMFLFNGYTHSDQHFPLVSAQLTKALIDKKTERPQMDILFLTDEINTNYHSGPNSLLTRLQQAGIRVVQTNVDPLRDSTPLYSAVWRTFFQWFGQQGTGWLPNLMADEGPKMTARSYLKLLNVKANHRKLVASEKSALISSGNVHDASAYHSNMALEVSGPIIAEIIESEQAVLRLSGESPFPDVQSQLQQITSPDQGLYQMKYLTEGKVCQEVLRMIQETDKGDTIHMGMFYLADRAVLKSLLEADRRDVKVQLLLDPNENAFGQEKVGIPNRPVADELNEKSNGSIQIRWYNTTFEQYHTKMMYIAKAQGPHLIVGGSTNFTKRNLKDLNLENELWVAAPGDSPLAIQVRDYFDRIWNNRDAEYSLALEAYLEDTVFLKDIVYHLQNILGFTTF